MPKLLTRTNPNSIDEFNFPYTLNPFIGCSFGCIYCYSKSPLWRARWGYHGYNNIDIPSPNLRLDFDDLLFKIHYDLETIQERREVQIGNTFDPYPSNEEHYRITQLILETFLEHPEWKVHLETKSPLILRDIDILQRLNDFEAEITLTTLNHDRYFEPQTPSTQRRLDLIRELADNDIFVRVMIMPVLGDYTDINEIMQIAFEYGARDFKIKDLNYKTIDQLVQEYNIPDVENRDG
jgi:DNA repair photolyase